MEPAESVHSGLNLSLNLNLNLDLNLNELRLGKTARKSAARVPRFGQLVAVLAPARAVRETFVSTNAPPTIEWPDHARQREPSLARHIFRMSSVGRKLLLRNALRLRPDSSYAARISGRALSHTHTHTYARGARSRDGAAARGLAATAATPPRRPCTWPAARPRPSPVLRHSRSLSGSRRRAPICGSNGAPPQWQVARMSSRRAARPVAPVRETR